MKKAFFLIAMLAASPAAAQSPQLENTCETVAKNFMMTDALHIGVVQSFPELKPPGVRFTYSKRNDVEKADMTDTFECQFAQATPPLSLQRFCSNSTCYSANERSDESKRRFQEMKVLLDRGQNK